MAAKLDEAVSILTLWPKRLLVLQLAVFGETLFVCCIVKLHLLGLAHDISEFFIG